MKEVQKDEQKKTEKVQQQMGKKNTDKQQDDCSCGCGCTPPFPIKR